jgi:hypothetical protein
MAVKQRIPSALHAGNANVSGPGLFPLAQFPRAGYSIPMLPQAVNTQTYHRLQAIMESVLVLSSTRQFKFPRFYQSRTQKIYGL